MIMKPCTQCRKLFAYNGHSRCNECEAKSADRKVEQRIYNQRYRNNESDKFYHSAAWKRLSKTVLINAHYRCAQCGKLATEVHHIVEITDDWNRRLDISNLVPLCTSCHNKQR